MKLRAFLELLEAHGGGDVSARDLAEALSRDGAATRSALRAEGILRDAARATTWPCDGLGCAREVRELRRPGTDARRFFAMCTRPSAECETIELDARDLAQETISTAAVAGVVQRALKLTPGSAAWPVDAPRPAASAPLYLGEEIVAGEWRDVYLVLHPRAAEVRALVAEAREGRGVRLLFLARVPEAIAKRYAGSTRAALSALSELLVVEDGRIAEARGPRGVAARASKAPPPANETTDATRSASWSPGPRCKALDGLPPLKRWGELTLFDVDEDDLLGVVIGGQTRRLSCIDIGLAGKNRRPVQTFELLKIICQGNGFFQTRKFGSPSNGKRIISELRTGMCAAFGLGDDPFERYSRVNKQWRAKFRALAMAPREMKAAVRGLSKQ